MPKRIERAVLFFDVSACTAVENHVQILTLTSRLFPPVARIDETVR
jgi:hypothetical protein